MKKMLKSLPQANNDIVIKKLTDYYPFGTEMYDRNYQTTDNRYAYLGQEKDDKTGWSSFQLRMYDGRIGRWNTTDPKGQYFSPYLTMGNNPVSQIDPDGGASGMPGMYVAPTELNTFSTYDALHWENFKNMSPQEYWRSQSQRALFKFMWNCSTLIRWL